MANDIVKKNATIEEIGYWFCGHYNSGSLHVQIETSGGGRCAFDIIASTKMSKFFNLFKNDESVDLENGIYAEKLKGKHLCAWFNEKGNGRICGLSPILDERGDEIVEV